jgi:hypothetical protein
LISATVLTFEFFPMIRPMHNGWLATTPTTVAGTPFARKPMPGPEPRPKSISPATMACCILASPLEFTISSLSPCLAQMPARLPMSRTAKASGFGTDGNFHNIFSSAIRANRPRIVMATAAARL